MAKFEKGKSGNPTGKIPGTRNKATKILKEQILEALDREGGVKYLQWLAQTNSSAFVALLGKVLPTKVEGEGNITITLEERIVKPGQLASKDKVALIEGRVERLIEGVDVDLDAPIDGEVDLD